MVAKMATSPVDVAHDPGQPLAHVILCCTSIPPERRSVLADIAAGMGAAHKLDLTTDVTHLLVGDIETPKYKYVAKERPDIKVLRPEWVEAVQQSWMQGGDTDVEVFEQEYKLPTFLGLRVSVTGFEDLAYRKELEEIINSNGGEYRGDLSRDVTHLIAHKPTGPKYSYAKDSGMHIVAIEWLQQSLERGMVLDEKLYDPLMEASQRGINAWIRRSISTTSLKKRPRREDGVSGPRKLRRTASARSNNQVGIWTDIVGGGYSEDEPKKHEWEEQDQERPVEQEPRKLDQTGEGSYGDVKPLFEAKTPTSDRMFSGKRFYLHGFDKKKLSVLQQHLQAHDAQILPRVGEMSQPTPENTMSAFILVPHNSNDGEIPSLLKSIPGATLVTDMWVERCLHKREYVEPHSNVTNLPFKFPIPGFEKLVISSTAFDGIDLLQLSKVVPLLGATYDEFLTEKSSILICNDPATKRDKLRFALKWGIPVVEPGWLWDCMRSGTQKSSHPHHIQPDAQVQTKDMTEEKRGEITAQVVDVERPKMRKRLPRTLRGSNSVDPGIETSESTSNGTNHETIDAHDTFQINDYDGLGSHDLAADAARKETSISTNLSTKDPPLQDVSTNSSSEKSTFPRDTSSNRDKSLSSDISSLLSLHRQRSESAVLSNTAQTNSSGVADPKNRRKRKLLGRAVSNLSVQSGLNVVGISRASSVDTLNTDGVGTPLEAIHPLPGGDETQALDDGISEARKALTAALLSTQGDIEHEQDHQALASAEFHPMMTQVAYDDPESGMWRERFLRKVGGAVVRDDKEKVQSKGKVAGTVKDSRDGDSVARRTRLASAR